MGFQSSINSALATSAVMAKFAKGNLEPPSPKKILTKGLDVPSASRYDDTRRKMAVAQAKANASAKAAQAEEIRKKMEGLEDGKQR